MRARNGTLMSCRAVPAGDSPEGFPKSKGGTAVMGIEPNVLGRIQRLAFRRSGERHRRAEARSASLHRWGRPEQRTATCLPASVPFTGASKGESRDSTQDVRLNPLNGSHPPLLLGSPSGLSGGSSVRKLQQRVGVTCRERTSAATKKTRPRPGTAPGHPQ